MPSKYLRRNFKPRTYHHICNRGSFKQKIFRKHQDYTTFTDILKYYLVHPNLSPLSQLNDLKLKKANKLNQPAPYQLLAYCLMPNHFHLLMKQKSKTTTISHFMQKISVTYTMYFQRQYDHSGSLFQGKFKSTQVFPDAGLIYISKYIHLNPKGSDPLTYPYSSIKDYLTNNKRRWIHSGIIIDHYFPNATDPAKDYQHYLKSEINSLSEQVMKGLSLEEK